MEYQTGNLTVLPKMAYNAEYDLFIGQTALRFNDYIVYAMDVGLPIPDDCGWGFDNMPCVNINLIDVCHYVNWLNPRVPYAYVKELVDRVCYYYPERKEALYQKLGAEADWRGFPPPYVIQSNDMRIDVIPEPIGFRIPDKDEWDNATARNALEDFISANNRLEKEYLHQNLTSNVQVGQLKGWPINGSDSHPSDLVYDLRNLVQEFAVLYRKNKDESVYVPVTEARSLMETYYKQFPEWEDFVRPRCEAFFKNQKQ